MGSLLAGVLPLRPLDGAKLIGRITVGVISVLDDP
jgi:hypothetical protein